MPTKQITLPPAQVSVTVSRAEGGAVLHLHTDRLARSVEIASDDAEAIFSDNFLDLLPSETRTLYIKTTAPLESIRASLHVRSLCDAFASHNDSPGMIAR